MTFFEFLHRYLVQDAAKLPLNWRVIETVIKESRRWKKRN